MRTDLSLLEVLYDALRARLGVVVRTNDKKRLRAKLYETRKSDPDLSVLSILDTATVPDQLYIVKMREPNGEDN